MKAQIKFQPTLLNSKQRKNLRTNETKGNRAFLSIQILQRCSYVDPFAVATLYATTEQIERLREEKKDVGDRKHWSPFSSV